MDIATRSPKMKLLSRIIVLFLSFFQISCLEEPLVRVEQGEVAGKWEKSLNGRLMAVFRGIPYASPPVGDRRFQKPEPMTPWTGVLQADKTPNNCIQWYHMHYDKEAEIVGSEDCLYLNVYTPTLSESAALPVIVYIHGGAFIFGSGSEYEGDYLMDKDVVYVSINYRLGALGFMSTEDDVVPGNAGLKDQVMALKFVKQNIKNFGGDPDKITAMGMSAGGASVNYHMISPLSSGLFAYAYSQSGTVFAPWTLQEEPLMKAKMIGSKLGCPTENTKNMVSCLEGKPAKDIVKTSEIFMPLFHTPFSPFAPVVEKVKTESSFITDHPYNLIKKGQIQHIPWLTSVTKDEGLYPAGHYISQNEILPEIDAKWEEWAPLIFDFNLTLPKNQLLEAAEKIKDEYLNGKPLSEQTFEAFVEALGDRHFAVSSEACARLYAKSSKSPVYFYKFAYRGKTSLGEFLSEKDDLDGVSHGDDTGYIIKTIYMDPTKEADDLQMINTMIDMILNFANTGIPKFNSVNWNPIDGHAADFDYLDIRGPSEAEMKKTRAFGRKDFWDSLNFQENEKIQHHRDEL